MLHGDKIKNATSKHAAEGMTEGLNWEKGLIKDRSWIENKYNKMSKCEALETAKQKFTALATRLQRYTREDETKRINVSKDNIN